ncbi:MAG: Hsp20/alpha crystallin family protein [Chloroflexi bacterium]|nr:MAG: Hsp20/alpha crystallin family protein [Chloroflexota bacterium]
MAKIVRWSPMRDMVNMHNEMDRMFEEAFNAPRLRWQEPTNWGLALDVAESEEGFLVQASVAGVNPNDIEITLSDNVLTIKGELKSDENIDDSQYHLRERRYGSFERSVTLSVPVNADAIDATYEHGVLSLTIPKAEEVKPKRIAIKHLNGKKVLEG